MLFGATALVVLLWIKRDDPAWREAAPSVLIRAAFLVALGLAIGAFLLLTER